MSSFHCLCCICVTDELLTPGTHLREESKNQGGHRSITWELGSEHNNLTLREKRVGFVARFGSVSDSGNHEAAFLVHSPHHLFLILESKHIDPPMSWQHGIHTWRPSDPRARPIGGDPDALMLWLLYCIGSVVNYFLVSTHLCVSCLEKASSM